MSYLGVFSRFGEFSSETLQVCNSTKEELSPFTGMLTNKLTSQAKESTENMTNCTPNFDIAITFDKYKFFIYSILR